MRNFQLLCEEVNSGQQVPSSGSIASKKINSTECQEMITEKMF